MRPKTSSAPVSNAAAFIDGTVVPRRSVSADHRPLPVRRSMICHMVVALSPRLCCGDIFMTDRLPPARPASYDKKVGLVLQGGGALGSYQAGVYQALAASEYLPDWVAGISIGAINAAIIAGNAPEHRVDRLRAFWDEVTAPTSFWPAPPDGPLAAWQQRASALTSALFGQPGYFVHFDSAHCKIRPEHVMASGALPPGFPPIEIGGELFWDGGLFSNTPLQYMVDYSPRRSRLIFQVDLFQAHGCVPTNLDEVNEREKDIRYSSRTRIVTEGLRERHNVRHVINELHKLLPPEIANTPEAKRLYEHGCVTEMDIALLIYRPNAPQGAAKDFEFSRSTMEARWQQGFSDACTTLSASPWLAPIKRDVGVRVFDVMHDKLVRQQQKPERVELHGIGADEMPMLNLVMAGHHRQ